jgi:hypothetical protein
MTPSETAPLQGAHLIASHLHALWTGPVSPASCGRCHGGDTCLRSYNKLNWPYAGREHHASRNNTTRANSRPCDGHGNARLQQRRGDHNAPLGAVTPSRAAYWKLRRCHPNLLCAVVGMP